MLKHYNATRREESNHIEEKIKEKKVKSLEKALEDVLKELIQLTTILKSMLTEVSQVILKENSVMLMTN